MKCEIKEVNILEIPLPRLVTLIDCVFQQKKKLQGDLEELESDYNQKRTEYELKLLEKKYSEFYSHFKTIKEKEERARLDLREMKVEILKLDSEVRKSKYEFNYNEKYLNYLFKVLELRMGEDK